MHTDACTSKLHSWVVEYCQSLCQHISTNVDALSHSNPTSAFLLFFFYPIPTTCGLSHGKYACKNTSPSEKEKVYVESNNKHKRLPNRIFLSPESLDSLCWVERFLCPFMPSRHDLIHLVGRHACVCCEIGFASSVCVSMEWHALCVFHNHGWENVSNDMEHKVY